jgi:dienelactone hydrolase
MTETPLGERPAARRSLGAAARRSRARPPLRAVALLGAAIAACAALVPLTAPAALDAVALADTGAAGGALGPAPPAAATPATGPAPYAVGLSVLRLVDPTRRIRLPGGRSAPRTLVTYVRYPALAAPGGVDVPDAPAARAGGPFPLVVFAHGFAATPATYARLLQSWAEAGYVVAAPLFPLSNANAPGGPDESDLVNQPRDMSVVITGVIAAGAAAASPLAGLVDPAHIAVAGQSDGGVTALAAAYSRRYRDPRVDAAVVLSGSMMSGVGGYSFTGAPPLLAAQGTADKINEPKYTYAFFRLARHPKYLLRLLGAGHLPPYTRQQPQLGVVERVSTEFLDGYLKGSATGLAQLTPLSGVPRVSALVADP